MLSALFDISVPTEIHWCSSVYREKYKQHVRWSSLEEWTNFQRRSQKLPFEVGGIDGISTDIYRPGIEPQKHYYSGNRQYHCIHTQVMITNDGEFESVCDKVCQWLATVRWFRPGTLVSSTNKTDRHDITEILIKVALNTTKQTNYKRRHYLLRRK